MLHVLTSSPFCCGRWWPHYTDDCHVETLAVWSIHPLSMTIYTVHAGSHRPWSLSQLMLGTRRGCTLDKSSVHRRTHTLAFTHTVKGQFRVTNSPDLVCLWTVGIWRTHAEHAWDWTQNPLAVRPQCKPVQPVIKTTRPVENNFYIATSVWSFCIQTHGGASGKTRWNSLSQSF